jgi:Flp pilus assembly protein TadG
MRRKRERGNAMLEFAIGATVFVALFTGTFQYGYTFYIYNNLISQVRAGARYGAIARYTSLSGFSMASPAVTGYNAPAVQNVVVYGDPAGGTTPTVPGLTTNNVKVDVSFASGSPDIVWVRINGYTLNAIFGTWSLVNKPTYSMVYQGAFTP